MAGGITNWKTFVETGRTLFDAKRGCPLFHLIEALDHLYRLAYLRAPFPPTGREENNFLHMCFLICHRALLSAATVTGSGRPEDGPAITRRALEAAKAALAVKVHPKNFQQWKSIETRKERWKARGQGEAPKGRVNPHYEGLTAETLYQDLQTVIGTLSDFTVHFTPEHVGGYEWQEISGPGGGIDRSFGVNEDAVPKGMLMLACQHHLMLRVFDRCLDGKMLSHPEVKEVAQRAFDLCNDMLRREGLIDEATTAGEKL